MYLVPLPGISRRSPTLRLENFADTEVSIEWNSPQKTCPTAAHIICTPLVSSRVIVLAFFLTHSQHILHGAEETSFNKGTSLFSTPRCLGVMVALSLRASETCQILAQHARSNI